MATVREAGPAAVGGTLTAPGRHQVTAFALMVAVLIASRGRILRA